MKEIQEALVWTTEPPTEPGWYWVRWKNGLCDVELGRLTDVPIGAMLLEHQMLGFANFSHFAGPIPEPQEEK
jgi:hypothetical protein